MNRIQPLNPNSLISEINAEIVHPPAGIDAEEKAYRKGVNMGKRQAVARLQALLRRVKSGAHHD